MLKINYKCLSKLNFFKNRDTYLNNRDTYLNTPKSTDLEI